LLRVSITEIPREPFNVKLEIGAEFVNGDYYVRLIHGCIPENTEYILCPFHLEPVTADAILKREHGGETFLLFTCILHD
jgi:hypothetical protein